MSVKRRREGSTGAAVTRLAMYSHALRHKLAG